MTGTNAAANFSLSKDDWTKNAEKYNKRDGNSYSLPIVQKAFDEQFFKVIDKLIKERKSKGDENPLKILCLCGGTGAETFVICQRYNAKEIEILTTDNSQGMLDYANKMIEKNNFNDRAKIQLCDAMEIPFTNSSFDIVTLILGPMLLSDPNRSFVNINRILKNDGIFLTICPGRMDIHDVMFTKKQLIFDKRKKGEKAKNAFMDNIVAKWGTPIALKERLEQSTFFKDVQTADDESYLSISNKEELKEILFDMFSNPGMQFMYLNDLDKEEIEIFKKEVLDEFLLRFKSSNRSKFGLKMIGNSSWARKS